MNHEIFFGLSREEEKSRNAQTMDREEEEVVVGSRSMRESHESAHHSPSSYINTFVVTSARL